MALVQRDGRNLHRGRVQGDSAPRRGLGPPPRFLYRPHTEDVRYGAGRRVKAAPKPETPEVGTATTVEDTVIVESTGSVLEVPAAPGPPVETPGT